MPCLTNRLMLHSSGPGLVLFCQRNIFLPCRDFQLKNQRDLQEVPYYDSIIVNLVLFKMYFLICTYMTTPIGPCSCSSLLNQFWQTREVWHLGTWFWSVGIWCPLWEPQYLEHFWPSSNSSLLKQDDSCQLVRPWHITAGEKKHCSNSRSWMCS